MQYLEKSDSLEKAQQGVQAAELERRVRAESAAGAPRNAVALPFVDRGAGRAPHRRSGRMGPGGVSPQTAAARNSSPNSSPWWTPTANRTTASPRGSTPPTPARPPSRSCSKGRVAAVRDIAATCYTYGEGERLSAKMRELTLSPAMLADVVRMADIYNDRAVDAAAGSISGWTGRNYDFAALVIAGFSPQEISVMLGMTLNGVYTLKSKLKRRIADAPAGGEFLRFFA